MASRALASVLMAGALAACRSTPPAAAPEVEHVLLVTVDTLRADRIGVYGSTTVRTPHLDRLAREGAMARQATAHVPLTRPSHTSIFTGLYPSEHGIRDNVSVGLSPDVPVMADLFASHGFRTAAFVSSVVLSRQSGLARGFQHYSDRFDLGPDDARFLNAVQKPGDRTVDEAVAWLSDGAPGRRFAWVHLYDPHDPYSPPEPYATEYAGRPYDGEVAWTDALIGRLDAALTTAGLRDRTLVVLTSDHGEGLDEHGESVHGFFVYESTLRVPLIVRGPGIAPGTQIPVVARSIDLLPTVLELAGLGAHTPTVSGRSLATALRGHPIDETVAFAESLWPLVHYGWSDLRALRDGRWKFILAPRPELYDLELDPGETRNLADRDVSRTRAYRSAIEGWLRDEQQRLQRQPSGTAVVPPEMLEQLGALGYVSLTRGTAPRATGADPKDKVGEFQAINDLMRHALIDLQEGRPASALPRFTTLLAQGIDSFEVHYYAGRACTALGRWREAAPHYARAAELFPAYAAAYAGWAEALLAQRQVQAAAEAVQRGLAQVPTDAALIEWSGEVARAQGNLPAAQSAFERVLPLAPTDSLIRVKLAELLRDTGRAEAAVPLLQEAVQLDPARASYWNSLGMTLGGLSRMVEAEQAFRSALTRDGGNARYAYNHGLALANLGRTAEARSAFRRALAADPAFTDARRRLSELP